MTTLTELITRLREQQPAAFGKLDDRSATRLLRSALAAIANDVAQAPDGAVRVAGLGVFQVRTLEANAEGKGGGRRVLFKPAPAKAAAAD
jgi:nucleoid DNA-binding protein